LSEPREIEFLPLVKAYPALSRRYGEVSCIAGLDMKTSEWIRLYPVPFRTLEDAQKFRKYEPIRARVQRPRDDRRPESWRVDAESIEVIGHVLGPEHGWKAGDRSLSLLSVTPCVMSGRPRKRRERLFRCSALKRFRIS
jgi:hypothetical protein